MSGVRSHFATIKAGVPQGSVLGPILFLVCINDLIEVVKSNMFLFADDGTIIDEFEDIRISIPILIGTYLLLRSGPVLGWSTIIPSKQKP